VILPSDPGHRWCDIRSRLPEEPGQAGSEVPRPDQGQAGSGLGRPDLATPGSGLGRPDQGYGGRPDPANQDQEQIREESSSPGQAGSGVPTDPRMAMHDAISAQAERAAEAQRRFPLAPMGGGVPETRDHEAICERFGAVLARWPLGSPERQRLAAVRPPKPEPDVLRQACEDQGLDRVLDVLEWAWLAWASGRLVKVDTMDASRALVVAFRGQGRMWREILAAHGKAQPRQQRLEWRPPAMGDVECASPDRLDALLEGFGQ
jgi:hypothetical protein